MAVKPVIRQDMQIVKKNPIVSKAIAASKAIWDLASRWMPSRILYIALRDFSRSNGVGLAAGVAFYALLSLFPLSLAAIAIAGYFYTGQDEQAQVVELIQELIPVSTDYLADTIDGVVSNRGQVSVIGVLGLLWAGQAVFSGLRRGINNAWGVDRPPNFLKQRMTDFGLMYLVGMAAFFILVFSAAIYDVPEVGQWLKTPGGGVVSNALAIGLSLAVAFVVLLIMYRFVPNRSVLWSDAWIGALVAALLLESGRHLFAWYVSRFADFNLIYGSLGALMAVMVWVYYSAIVILFGAQLCATYCRILGSDARKPL
jgi:membrane protein